MTYFIGLTIQDHDQSVALVHGGCNALLQTLLFLIAYRQLIDYDFNIMIFIAVNFRTKMQMKSTTNSNAKIYGENG